MSLAFDKHLSAPINVSGCLYINTPSTRQHKHMQFPSLTTVQFRIKSSRGTHLNCCLFQTATHENCAAIYSLTVYLTDQATKHQGWGGRCPCYITRTTLFVSLCHSMSQQLVRQKVDISHIWLINWQYMVAVSVEVVVR